MKRYLEGRQRFAVVLGAATLASGTASLAATAQDWRPSHYYAGIGAGASRADIDFSNQVRSAYAGTPFDVLSANVTRRDDAVFKVFGGANLWGPVGAEIGYIYLGSPHAQYALHSNGALAPPAPFTRDATYRIQGINFSATATLPVNEQFALDGRVGGFYSRLSYSERGSQGNGDAFSFNAPTRWRASLSFGAGVSYRLSPAWSLRADWDRFQRIGETFALTESGNGRFANIDSFMLGIVYGF